MCRGLLHERMGQNEEAAADLHAACVLEPDNAAFLRSRGISHRTSGAYEAALADFDRVLQLVPEDPVALSNRG